MRVIKALVPKSARALRRRVYERLFWALGKPDRQYMETVLLPALARLAPRRVLNVGVRGYCAHYCNFFLRGAQICEYYTLAGIPHLDLLFESPPGDSGDFPSPRPAKSALVPDVTPRVGPAGAKELRCKAQRGQLSRRSGGAGAGSFMWPSPSAATAKRRLSPRSQRTGGVRRRLRPFETRRTDRG